MAHSQLADGQRTDRHRANRDRTQSRRANRQCKSVFHFSILARSGSNAKILLTLSSSKGEEIELKIYVYMLRCRDKSYYVGLAREGLDNRIADHQSGRYPGYTSNRRPVELVWSQDFIWLKDVIACERRIKGWRREKKEALIRGDYEALNGLARTAKNAHPSTGSG